jgi:hypothetical protein
MKAHHVDCAGCGWTGSRLFSPGGDELLGLKRNEDRQGFGLCPRCGVRLARRRNRHQERRFEQARRELQGKV